MSGFIEARPRVGYYYSGKSKNKLVSDHLRQYIIKDHMSLPVIVKEDTTIYDAICTIFLEDTGTLFITNQKDELIGVSSRKDLLRASMIGQDIHTMPISIIMSRMPNIVYLEEEDLVIYAASQMIDKEIDSIPVVRKKENSKYKVVGRISKTTITKLFVSLFKE